jgi:hypothetical protein
VKISAADLGAQMDTDFRHGNTGSLCADRLTLVELEWLVHGRAFSLYGLAMAMMAEI